MRLHRDAGIAFLLLACISFAARAADNSGFVELRAKTLPAFTSGDDTQIAAALQTLRTEGRHIGWKRERVIDMVMQFNRYDDAEQLAVQMILDDPSWTIFVAPAEKLRAQAFLAQGKAPQALSAARTYYDLALLKDSSDAIDLVALCLALGQPNDPTAAARFKKQQIAWAAAAPTSDPSNLPQSTSLGDPVLPNILPDSKPFEAAADGIKLLDYKQFAAKGNLLLLSGKATEARDLFERAQGIAPAAREAEAIESVARAIRAQAGCIAPANAYILQVREQQQQ